MVQEAAGGQEALEVFSAWQPHLVWMDMRMLDVDGYEATRRIKATAQGQATPVIAITASGFEEEQAAVLASGCNDFVRKPIREGEIFEVMSKLLGVRYLFEDLTPSEEPVVRELTPTPGPLTPRELDVLRCLAWGVTNREIAAELSVSVRTVTTHVRNILDKLHLADRTQAALYAVEQGLTSES